ncbi:MULTISPECIES: hypothetical protein [Herpetosiphon]|uniref:Uncharacterized protein n=1 Tax=Herpetosiphon gulosus TaxID=1973496 RepID=A0ABP9X864_9CHLR|nr:hypothetical protein [Herpetosiphon llansteffanensis]
MIRFIKDCMNSRVGRILLGLVVTVLVASVLWNDGLPLIAGIAGGTLGTASILLGLACLIPCLIPLAFLRRKARPATPAPVTNAACGCGDGQCASGTDGQ